MKPSIEHRLEGLEPDNLLVFLSLLGLLRALEVADRERAEDQHLYPRARWDIDTPPVRPVIVLRSPLTQGELLEIVCRGVDALTAAHDFSGRKDLSYSRAECRAMLEDAMRSSTGTERQRVDLLSALMCDAALKDKDRVESVAPTPLCLLFGQGHQHFLDRLASVPRQPAPPPPTKRAPSISAEDCLAQALFEPWHRNDATFSFRWDPAEDVRYALMAGDPTDAAYKPGTQHGANRLAAIGLGALSLAPEVRAGKVRPGVIGGDWSADGFSFSWPIWREPASLAAIRALLSHPGMRDRSLAGIEHLGVEHVMTAQRISVGKFMNFTRARMRLVTERRGRLAASIRLPTSVNEERSPAQ